LKSKRAILAILISTLLIVSCSQKPASSDAQPGAQPQPNAANPSANQPTDASAQPAPAPAAAAPAPAPEPPPPIVVPAGTSLTVKLDSAISSKSAQPGQAFSATLARTVSVGGEPAIPAGSAVSGSVLDAKKQGAIKGEATLALGLSSITVNGRTYPITTSAFMQTTKGKGKRSAVSIGGGTAGGALIGGLAGGGKGAAIGALVGAGAGTAVAAGTGGQNVNLPAEAAVSFKLTSDLTIQPPQQ
jgi:hypothetical protein